MTADIDPDGMPLAPPQVLTANEGAFVVFAPAMEQATSFHVPTDAEKQAIIAILDAWTLARKNGAPSAATTRTIMVNARALNLYVCRAKFTFNNEPASVLLFYTLPGITNYSGPFMMLKETKASKFVIYSPHDDSDGTYAATKLPLMKSYALACFSNGHHRGKVSGGDINIYRMSDFVHSPSVDENLGDVAIEYFEQLFPGSVSILFNGIADPTKCMLHSRSDDMANVFKDTMIKNTRITADDFTDYTPWFTIDSIINTNYYIKCEIPSVIYENNYSVVTSIALAMEQQPWCWSS